jgi:hypothetical protein
MKPDLYTKGVLTIIAACLLALVARSSVAIQPAHASGSPIEVNIVEVAGKAVRTKTFGAEGALPVTTGVDGLSREVPITVATH